MKRIIYRNCPLNLLIASIIIYGLAAALCGVGLYVALVVEDPAFIPVLRYILIFCYGVAFCIPIVLIVMSGIAFAEKVSISEDTIEFRRGKRLIGSIPCQEITVFGSAEFMHRNRYTFFCSTPLDEILLFSQHNHRKAVRYFGKHRLTQAEACNDRMWQIAVGTYIHSERGKDHTRIIVLKNETPKVLKEISNLLHQKPILTGPIIMDNLDLRTK